MTKTFTVFNPNSGLDLGVYEAETEAQAIDLACKDAGYEGTEDACQRLGIALDELELMAQEQ